MRCSALLLLLACTAAAAPSGGDVSFTVLHTNDMHARFEQTGQRADKCRAGAEDTCFGGFARVAHVVREARARAARGEGPPVLFLNAGDTYQGSVWYTVHRWRIVARFLNLLAPDAASLGNHEFDDRVEGLVPFLHNVSFPVVAANLDTSEEPDLEASPLVNSTVVNLPDGTPVGIIGYLTPETKILSSTGKVKFLDEVQCIRDEAQKLKQEGINILIALGHSGFLTDIKIATEVPDIDLVIGGHTNTFLFNGNDHDIEIPQGLYPTIITQASGRKVPVVQAYAYTKYLGNLTLIFDKDGEIKSVDGNPILLNSKIHQDADILEELEKWRPAVINRTQEILGQTRVLLDGATNHCRLYECNFGNLITDAMIFMNAKNYHGDGWTNAPIALQNGGSIRTSIDATSVNGIITMEDVLAALPFENIMYREEINGTQLLEALETGAYYYEQVTGKGVGAFLQLSGVKVTYDISKPPGERVVDVFVRCGYCRVPMYSPLNETEIYGVLVPAFLKDGGDNFTVFQNSIQSTPLDYTDTDNVAQYIKQKSPVYPGIENRTSFLPLSTENQEPEESQGSAAHTVKYFMSTTTLLLPIVFTCIVLN